MNFRLKVVEMQTGDVNWDYEGNNGEITAAPDVD